MTAAKRDLYIEQGATFQLSFVWHEGSADNVGLPVDLTNATARMQIRKAQQSPLIVDATTEGPTAQIALGGSTGTITLTLTPTDTSKLAVKSAAYDLEVQFSDGRVVRLLEGSVTVSPNITQVLDEPVVGP